MIFLIWCFGGPLFSGADPFVQFCDTILSLCQWFRRRCVFKIFLIWSFGGPLVQRSRTICANLVEGIVRNNSVKLFRIWPVI